MIVHTTVGKRRLICKEAIITCVITAMQAIMAMERHSILPVFSTGAYEKTFDCSNNLNKAALF